MATHRSRTRLIGYNLLVFCAICILIEFVSALILDSHKLYHQGEPLEIEDERPGLPNYDPYPWAKQHFKEMYQIQAAYKSYIGWRRKAFSGETINIDRLGIRFTVQDTQSVAEKPTVIFLGGSTMWGTGVDDAHTIPSIFAVQTHQAYQVINFGESAYSAFQSYQFLNSQILEGLRPELVISYDGTNNSPAHLPSFFAHQREHQFIKAMEGLDRGENGKPFLFQATRALAQRIGQKFSKPPKPSIPTFSSRRNKEAAIELLESWLFMKRRCAAISAEFVCILQANPFVGKANIEHIAERLAEHPYQKGYEYYQDVLALIESPTYHELLPHFLDFTHVLDDMPMVYIDFCHVSPNGNAVIVDTLMKRLKGNEILRLD